jgi:hypothetical protein
LRAIAAIGTCASCVASGEELVSLPDRDRHEDFLWSWQGWAIAELLRDEAAELLGITKPKPESTSVKPTEEAAKPDNSTTTSPPTSND